MCILLGDAFIFDNGGDIADVYLNTVFYVSMVRGSCMQKKSSWLRMFNFQDFAGKVFFCQSSQKFKFSDKY